MYWGPPVKKNQKKTNDDEEEEELSAELCTQKNHIYFYGDVTCKSVLKLNQILNQLNEPGNRYEEIWLHINSYGGTIYDALAAVDTITASPTPVISLIEGIAASAATMLSIAADKRLIRPNGVVLIHQLRGGSFGKKSDLDDEVINLNKLEKKLIEFYVKSSKLNASKIKKLLSRELEYSAKDCIKFGLVDEIYSPNVLGKRKR